MINLTSFLSYHQLDELCSRKSKLLRGIAKKQVEQGIILIRRVTDITDLPTLGKSPVNSYFLQFFLKFILKPNA
jgi:hypothetical protein